MFRRFSINFAILSMAMDGICIIAALIIAQTIRPELSRLPLVAPINAPDTFPWFFFLGFPIIWIIIFLQFSIYDGRRNLRVIDELTSLTLGSTLASIALAGLLYLSYRNISRIQFLSFLLIAILLLVAWRLGIRLVFRLKNGRYTDQRRVLIIGAGPVGRELQTQIVNNDYLGLSVLGFLDDDPQKRKVEKDILGTLDEATRIITQNKVDDVVLALPRRAFPRVDQLVAELHKLPVKVRIIPDYFHLALYKADIDEFAGIPMLDLRAPALNEYQRMVKRIFDLVLGCLIIPFLLPVLGILVLAVWLDDPGPVFFRQLRVGENRKLFKMLKFRSMVVDAEDMRHMVEKADENGNLIHKTPDDPRVTRVGRFLRRTSMDELPQIFNVLKGEMSFVGPRPELPYLVEKYEPWQRSRFAVPQGITGWWQIHGRSDKPMHLHTEEDLYYVQHYSFWLDIQILIQTFWIVLRGKGAY